jgi:uncharacterized membrane protein
MENLKQVKVSVLSVRALDEMLPWYVFLLPMIMTVGVIGYTILQYDLLPEQIPTHWGINGVYKLYSFINSPSRFLFFVKVPLVYR